MSDMKCPFCQQELVRHWGMTEPALYCCDNPKCSRGGVATESAWQELIRTRKALEVAQSVLKNISSFYKSLILANPVSDINWDVVAKNFAKHSDEALDQIKQITALEQKD